jgi:hypothetical protein
MTGRHLIADQFYFTSIVPAYQAKYTALIHKEEFPKLDLKYQVPGMNAGVNDLY